MGCPALFWHLSNRACTPKVPRLRVNLPLTDSSFVVQTEKWFVLPMPEKEWPSSLRNTHLKLFLNAVFAAIYCLVSWWMFSSFFQTVLCASSPNPAILPSFLQNCVLDFPTQKNKNQLIGWALNSIRPITVTNPMPCSRCGPVRREEPARKKPPPATFLSTGHGAAWSEHQEPAAECPSLPRRLLPPSSPSAARPHLAARRRRPSGWSGQPPHLPRRRRPLPFAFRWTISPSSVWTHTRGAVELGLFSSHRSPARI
jgi:hypothetical protein